MSSTSRSNIARLHSIPLNPLRLKIIDEAVLKVQTRGSFLSQTELADLTRSLAPWSQERVQNLIESRVTLTPNDPIVLANAQLSVALTPNDPIVLENAQLSEETELMTIFENLDDNEWGTMVKFLFKGFPHNRKKPVRLPQYKTMSKVEVLRAWQMQYKAGKKKSESCQRRKRYTISEREILALRSDFNF